MATRDIIQAAAGVGGGETPLYVEDVFSTYLYTGNGSSQNITNGIALADGASSPGWIATLGGTTLDQGQGITIDSSGNIYVAGRSDSSGAGSNDFLIAKYNSSGTIQWQRTLGGTSTDLGYGITVDSSGNIYVIGYTDSTGAGSNDFLIAKYNSSGTIQWQRTLGNTGNDQGYGITVDSSGNIYVIGYTQSTGAGVYDVLIAKYDSSGAIQWQRTLGGANYDYGYGITVDSSGNIYVVGYTNSSGAGSNDFLIAKYDSSGTIQWQRALGGNSHDYGYGITVDSSGNIYVVGETASTGAGSRDCLIAKYNSSGTIQWQRTLGGTGNEFGYGISVDSSGNIYVAGHTASTGAGSNDCLIAKYNSSGTIQWQRTLGNTGNDQVYGMTVDSSGNVYVTGRTNSTGAGSYDVLIARLPGDGSGVGTYGPFTYAASSLTDAASSLTSATSSLTDAASSLTDAASSLTDASASLTSSLTEVPVVVGEGGLVWIKSRNNAINGDIFDTERGAGRILQTASTAAEAYTAYTQNTLTAFNSNGFSLGTDSGNWGANFNNYTYASWTFRKAPKFFDIVTWTGDGTTGRAIAHNLDADVGFIVAKKTNGTGDWNALHRSIPFTGSPLNGGIRLNLTGAGNAYVPNWDDTFPTSTHFYVSDVAGASNATLNTSGETYVAYLFAHDAGGFGDDGTENVISCGSYTGNGLTDGPVVTLGYEPQLVIIKNTSNTGNWIMLDVMRGMDHSGNGSNYLLPNTTGAEGNNGYNYAVPYPTGFQIKAASGASNTNGDTYIYVAIRRGPMKTPTSGTEVFSPLVVNNSAGSTNTTGFPIDLQIFKDNRAGTGDNKVSDRLRGVGTTPTDYSTPTLVTNSTVAESSNSITRYWNNTGFETATGIQNSNLAVWNFRRAPGFFDVVAYTGTGVAHAETHNLGVAPEMMIVKKRSGNGSWCVYHQGVAVDPETDHLFLESTAAVSDSTTFWNDTAPTNTNFTVGTYTGVNLTSETFIAYLFATLAGVSKVGSYTGTGTTNQIDCGFSSGARFVLIKRADSTGDWYVYDSARGIVAGNDPYLLLNSTAAEVTSTDYVDTYSAGFELTSTAPAGLNASGGTYIYLAIA